MNYIAQTNTHFKGCRLLILEVLTSLIEIQSFLI